MEAILAALFTVKLPWSSSGKANSDLQQSNGVIKKKINNENLRDGDFVTINGKRYAIKSLPENVMELIRGMKVADRQLRIYKDKLKVLAVGRQSLALELNAELESIPPLTSE